MVAEGAGQNNLGSAIAGIPRGSDNFIKLPGQRPGQYQVKIQVAARAYETIGSDQPSQILAWLDRTVVQNVWSADPQACQQRLVLSGRRSCVMKKPAVVALIHH